MFLFKNVVIFCVDNFFPWILITAIKYNLILRKSLTKTLDDTMKTAEAKYSINFSRSRRKFFTKKKRINMNRVGANVDSMKG